VGLSVVHKDTTKKYNMNDIRIREHSPSGTLNAYALDSCRDLIARRGPVNWTFRPLGGTDRRTCIPDSELDAERLYRKARSALKVGVCLAKRAHRFAIDAPHDAVGIPVDGVRMCVTNAVLARYTLDGGKSVVKGLGIRCGGDEDIR
jgi:hypothetical protein